MNGADRKGQLIAEIAALYDVQPKDLRNWLESPARKIERPNKGGRPSVLDDYDMPKEKWDEVLNLILANRFFDRHDAAGQPIHERKARKIERIAEHVVDQLVEEGKITERGEIAKARTRVEKAVWDRWGRERDLARAAAADNPPPDLDGDWYD